MSRLGQAYERIVNPMEYTFRNVNRDPNCLHIFIKCPLCGHETYANRVAHWKNGTICEGCHGKMHTDGNAYPRKEKPSLATRKGLEVGASYLITSRKYGAFRGIVQQVNGETVQVYVWSVYTTGHDPENTPDAETVITLPIKGISYSEKAILP